jgi:hypothetical protein
LREALTLSFSPCSQWEVCPSACKAASAAALHKQLQPAEEGSQIHILIPDLSPREVPLNSNINPQTPLETNNGNLINFYFSDRGRTVHGKLLAQANDGMAIPDQGDVSTSRILSTFYFASQAFFVHHPWSRPEPWVRQLGSSLLLINCLCQAIAAAPTFSTDKETVIEKRRKASPQFCMGEKGNLLKWAFLVE